MKLILSLLALNAACSWAKEFEGFDRRMECLLPSIEQIKQFENDCRGSVLMGASKNIRLWRDDWRLRSRRGQIVRSSASHRGCFEVATGFSGRGFA